MTEGTSSPLLEKAFKFVQDCLASVPVLVLGSGHSCAFGIPGTEELAKYICVEVSKEVEQDDKIQWAIFEDKIKSLTLEAALQEVQISPHLSEQIIRKTHDCIVSADRKLLYNVIQNPDHLPLVRLYHHIFNSTHQRLQIITTNYDCLAEYAANAAGYAWATGFAHGYIGARYGSYSLSISKGNTAFRMVDLWKVHGSLDWYRGPDGSTLYLPSLTDTLEYYSPVIVTPGIDKYRRTHEEPFRTIIAGADSAMDMGKSFLCVGYGFNDEHIQPKLLDRCKRGEKSIVVLAMKLTAAAKRVLLDGKCKCFVAFEKSGDGTRMYTPEYLAGVELPNVNLWLLGSLLGHVL